MVKSRYAVLLVVILSLAFADVADARWRWRRRSVFVARSPAAWHAANDQGKCLIEAQYMHDHRIRGHVFGLIGHYEGCGWSGPGCSTCVPRRRMKLTGDAQVGNYRVRSWR